MTGNLAFGEETAPLQIELPARPESVALARHAVAEYAQRHGTDGGRVALAVSEAVTSALVRGFREQGHWSLPRKLPTQHAHHLFRGAARTPPPHAALGQRFRVGQGAQSGAVRSLLRMPSSQSCAMQRSPEIGGSVMFFTY